MVNNNLGYSIYSKDSLPQLGGKKKTRKSRSKKQRGSGLASSRPVDVERANNMLLQASRQGLSERVLESLENGADVNVKGSNDMTALIIASAEGHQEIVSMLLEKGANVNAKGKSGVTALIIASLYGFTEIVAMLLEKGANVKGSWGDTPLLKAIQNGHQEIVSMLLEKGADVNAKSKYGSVPALSFAVQNEYPNIVSMLLEKGVDVNAKSKYGVTAVMWARENGHHGIVNLLKNYELQDTINLEVVRSATQRGKTELPDAAKRIFNFEPGQGPDIRDFLIDNRPRGGKRKSKKAKKVRKVRANKSKKVKKQNIRI